MKVITGLENKIYWSANGHNFQKYLNLNGGDKLWNLKVEENNELFSGMSEKCLECKHVYRKYLWNIIINTDGDWDNPFLKLERQWNI